MFDCAIPATTSADVEIAQYDVSEDGVTWRPYDPVRDQGAFLHTRITFASPKDERN